VHRQRHASTHRRGRTGATGLSAPRVSVCVPTYDGALYLGETLESILAQTFGDFEILVVDDGSTDGTLDVVASFKDPRLALHRNPRRLGLPDNWNRCLALARGEFVKFVFQDDTVTPSAIARLLHALEADPEAAFAFSRREIRHEGPHRERLPLVDDFYANLLQAFYASFRQRLRGVDFVTGTLRAGRDLTVNVLGEPSFTLLRREAARRVGGFDPAFQQLSDLEFWLRLACGAAIAFVDEPLGMFRVHARGASAANHTGLRVRWEFVRLAARVRRLYGPRLDDDLQSLLARQEWRFRRHLVGGVLRAAVGGI
jgi:glycosyltransferase involved in cell wall biosynthesis